MIVLLFFSLFAHLPSNANQPVLATETETANSFLFDFGSGSSPVAEGYTQVTNATKYNSERGYGISKDEIAYRDRGNPDDMRRDFIIDGDFSFLVDVPNGEYYVNIIAGDDIAFNRTGIAIEGEDKGSISSGAGNYAEYTEVVAVNDGQLTIDLSENGRINGIEIAAMLKSPELYLENIETTPESSVTFSWDTVDGADRYYIYKKQRNSDDFVKMDSTETTKFTDEDVELGLSYSYAVSAVNSVGIESNKSPSLDVTVADESIQSPDVPSNLGLKSVTEDEVSLEWEATDNTVSYYIYRSSNKDGAFQKIATSENPNYTDDSIVTSKHFYYKVFSVNEGGLSEAPAPIKTPITVEKLRYMEKLDRGLVAVKTEEGIYVGWRMLGTDPDSISFDVIRDGEKINERPITSSTNFFDQDGKADSTYQVRVLSGDEPKLTEAVEVWNEKYLDIPLQKPEGGTINGEEFTYRANDASVADLDGDGQYEIVLQWDPSNSQDNSRPGFTGNTYIDAYELDGTHLWRIDLGVNIRSGAHYTQFLVYDFDGNGKAEVAFKTADGTIDGKGNVIGNADADYRNSSGYVLDGPEYLTIFNGETGEAIDTVNYEPPRGNVNDWGDGYGNRVDRFLAGVAYLDGENPSLVMARGYYTRTVLVAYDFQGGELVKRWKFDSDEPGNKSFAGQGFHSLSINDVDNDGKDEIVYGNAVMDDDGTAMYTTGLGHGDAMHVSDFDPNRPGMEVFTVQESSNAKFGISLRDAETGKNIWGVYTGQDTGRGLIADIDPRYPGAEAWAIDGAWNSQNGGIYTTTGEKISSSIPPANFAIWWDGDLLREALDHDWNQDKGVGVGTIGKWDYENNEMVNLLTAEGTYSNNYTKGNPSLQADILGDWREEVIWRTEDSSALRIYTTTEVTDHRIYTLMHDPEYRLGIAWQNIGYNQPPHTSYFLGHDMENAPIPTVYTGKMNTADVELTPHTLNLKSKGGKNSLQAKITLTSLAEVDTSNIRIKVNGQTIFATDANQQGKVLTAKFDRQQVNEAFKGINGDIEVEVIGYLKDGNAFLGRDSIRVIH
nr:hypothetical protein [Aquibacillus albus]